MARREYSHSARGVRDSVNRLTATHQRASGKQHAHASKATQKQADNNSGLAPLERFGFSHPPSLLFTRIIEDQANSSVPLCQRPTRTNLTGQSAIYQSLLSRSEFQEGQVPLKATGSCSWCWKDSFHIQRLVNIVDLRQ